MDIWTERLEREHLPLPAQWLARRDGALTPSDLPTDCAGLPAWFEAHTKEPGRRDFLILVYETPVGLAGLHCCGEDCSTAELWVLLGEVGYNLQRTATQVTLRMLNRAFLELGYAQVLVPVFSRHGWFLEVLACMGFTRAAEQDGLIRLCVDKAAFLNRKYLF